MEVVEEGSIEFLTRTIADSAILGDELDLSHMDDVVVQSIIMGGGMNAPGATYGTIMTQMATSDFRKEGLTKIEALKRIEAQMATLKAKGDDSYRSELIAQYSAVLSEMNFMKDGLEVDAMLVGAENVKKLIELNYDQSQLDKKAGIKPNDKNPEKTREQYIKTLTKSEAKNYQGRLDAIKEGKNRIHKSINYDGSIEKLFGAKGLQINEKLSDKKNTSQAAKDYRSADKRGKLVAISQQVKTDITNNWIKKGKEDPKTKQFVEENIYSERDADGKITKKMNFEQWKKATGKKNRKKKQEESMYEWAGRTLLASSVDSRMLFREGDVSATSILSEEAAKNLKIKKVENETELKQSVYESNLSDSRKAQLIEDIESGDVNAAIIGSDYIVIGNENFKAVSEKLAKGDIMQGTAMAHEISHFVDDAGMTKKELADYGSKLHSFANKHKNLAAINKLTIRRLIELGYWKGGENANFEAQNETTKDEYIRELQSFLMSDQFSAEYNIVKNEVSQSVINKLRGLIGGDYKITKDVDAMNYMIAFIENFRNGKISDIAKRKIAVKQKKLVGVKVGAQKAPSIKMAASRSKVVDVINKMEKGAETKAEFQKPSIFNNIYNSIVKKDGAINNYVKTLGLSKEKFQETIDALSDRLMNYDPAAKRKTKTGEPITIGEFLMANIGFAKLEAAKALAIEGKRKGLERPTDLGETTKEGDVKMQVEDTDVSAQEALEQEDMSMSEVSKARREKTKSKEKQYSKFRRQLGIETGSDLYNKILSTAKKSLLRAYEVGTSVRNIQRKLRDEAAVYLFKDIKNFLGTKEYINNLKKYRTFIVDAIFTADLVQLEKMVPENERVFTVFDRELTSKADVESAVEQNLLPKEALNVIDKGNAVRLYRKIIPTEKQFIAFFNQPAINPKTGVRSGLKGTRKDALAKAMAGSLSFDATMEVAKDPKVNELRKDIAEIKGQTLAIDDIQQLSAAIGRDIDVKFGRSTKEYNVLKNTIKLSNVLTDRQAKRKFLTVLDKKIKIEKDEYTKTILQELEYIFDLEVELRDTKLAEINFTDILDIDTIIKDVKNTNMPEIREMAHEGFINYLNNTVSKISGKNKQIDEINKFDDLLNNQFKEFNKGFLNLELDYLNFKK